MDRIPVWFQRQYPQAGPFGYAYADDASLRLVEEGLRVHAGIALFQTPIYHHHAFVRLTPRNGKNEPPVYLPVQAVYDAYGILSRYALPGFAFERLTSEPARLAILGMSKRDILIALLSMPRVTLPAWRVRPGETLEDRLKALQGVPLTTRWGTSSYRLFTTRNDLVSF